MKVGDRFEVWPPSANGNLHDNTITGCAQPAAFNGHGSDTSFFRNNLIERGGATNATQAIVGTGQFKLTGNHIAGFDEKERPVGTALRSRPRRPRDSPLFQLLERHFAKFERVYEVDPLVCPKCGLPAGRQAARCASSPSSTPKAFGGRDPQDSGALRPLGRASRSRPHPADTPNTFGAGVALRAGPRLHARVGRAVTSRAEG